MTCVSGFLRGAHAPLSHSASSSGKLTPIEKKGVVFSFELMIDFFKQQRFRSWRRWCGFVAIALCCVYLLIYSLYFTASVSTALGLHEWHAIASLAVAAWPGTECRLLQTPLVLLESTDSFRVVLQSNCLEFLDERQRQSFHCLVLEDGFASSASITPQWYRSLRVNQHHAIASLYFNLPAVLRARASIAGIKCNGVGVPASFRFQIPPTSPALNVSLAVISDAQDDTAVFRRLLDRVAKRDKPTAFLYAGDATQHSTPLQWSKFIDAIDRGLFSQRGMVPIAAARGNHDSVAVVGAEINDVLLSTSDDSHVMSIAMGGAQIVIIDADWVLRNLRMPVAKGRDEFFRSLGAALNATAWRTAPFRIVMCHVPTVIEWWEPVAWFDRREQNEPLEIARLLWPHWRDAGVDIIVGGHSHMYSHRLLEGGVHEFIVGGGGGDLEKTSIVKESTSLFERITHHYVWIEVQNCTLRWTARDLNDAPIETLELKSRRPQCTST